jgi:hypothetical protein
MRPRKSSAPEDPPELPTPRELELDRELDELLRELLLPLDREPPLNDWPPPGRADKNATLERPVEGGAARR